MREVAEVPPLDPSSARFIEMVDRVKIAPATGWEDDELIPVAVTDPSSPTGWRRVEHPEEKMRRYMEGDPNRGELTPVRVTPIDESYAESKRGFGSNVKPPKAR